MTSSTSGTSAPAANTNDPTAATPAPSPAVVRHVKVATNQLNVLLTDIFAEGSKVIAEAQKAEQWTEAEVKALIADIQAKL